MLHTRSSTLLRSWVKNMMMMMMMMMVISWAWIDTGVGYLRDDDQGVK
jgi:hypothetical protein